MAPSCNATDLCRAHIIPQGFARTLSGHGGHNRVVRASGSKPANQPLGSFDTEILCGPCDARLGLLDGYAIEFSAGIASTPAMKLGTPYSVARFDGDHFAKAMLAILWRASISRRPEWADIALGPYEAVAASILFGSANLSAGGCIEIVLMRYASSDHDARKFIFNPIRIRSGDLNIFVFGVGGFQVLAKFDKRPFHAWLLPYIINGGGSLATIHMPLEQTAEFQLMVGAAAADRRRSKAARSRK